MIDVDVVVVGAGLSGLMAARKVKELRGAASVVVLEGRDRVGGRMVRREVQAGGKRGWIDLGGQWIGDTQNRIKQLAVELGINTFEQYSEGNTVLWYNGRRYLDAGDDDTDIPAPNDEFRAAADKLSKALWQTANRVVPDPAKPWASTEAAECDKLTLAQWLSKNSDNDDYARFYVGHDATLNHSGGSPEQMSLLHTLFEIKANPPAEGPDEYLLKGAAGQIPPLLHSQLGGDEVVKLNSTVVGIDQDRYSITVHVVHRDGRYTAYRAKTVIVAIPPLLAGRIRYSIDNPEQQNWMAERLVLTAKMAMGTIAKVTCVYNTPWWRSPQGGLSGTALVQGRLIAGTDDSGLPDGDEGPGILTSFIQGTMYSEWVRLSPQDRKQRVLAELAALFGEDVANPADYVEALWPREPFTGGAYTAYLPPGAWTRCGMPLSRPVGRISWAGTETASRWYGYFDGAATAGERAAGEAAEWL
jgi:L-amino acid dehydrogenase